ncbi:hypothetical protein ACIQUB_29185 [Rhizobium sp. NPDC090275]|uniref:hypothetical protein n=1 Tax=Rhizobium sp. NPDC090275 TaxID=3364498 RepID=UPI00383BB40A
MPQIEMCGNIMQAKGLSNKGDFMGKGGQAVAKLSSLIDEGNLSGAVSMSQIEAAIQVHQPLATSRGQKFVLNLYKKYQAMTSNNDAETIMWRVL